LNTTQRTAPKSWDRPAVAVRGRDKLALDDRAPGHLPERLEERDRRALKFAP
jgi:hypothetical protein